jgi:hypothetical protein
LCGLLLAAPVKNKFVDDEAEEDDGPVKKKACTKGSGPVEDHAGAELVVNHENQHFLPFFESIRQRGNKKTWLGSVVITSGVATVSTEDLSMEVVNQGTTFKLGYHLPRLATAAGALARHLGGGEGLKGKRLLDFHDRINQHQMVIDKHKRFSDSRIETFMYINLPFKVKLEITNFWLVGDSKGTRTLYIELDEPEGNFTAVKHKSVGEVEPDSEDEEW